MKALGKVEALTSLQLHNVRVKDGLKSLGSSSNLKTLLLKVTDAVLEELGAIATSPQFSSGDGPWITPSLPAPEPRTPGMPYCLNLTTRTSTNSFGGCGKIRHPRNAIRCRPPSFRREKCKRVARQSHLRVRTCPQAEKSAPEVETWTAPYRFVPSHIFATANQ